MFFYLIVPDFCLSIIMLPLLFLQIIILTNPSHILYKINPTGADLKSQANMLNTNTFELQSERAAYPLFPLFQTTN